MEEISGSGDALDPEILIDTTPDPVDEARMIVGREQARLTFLAEAQENVRNAEAKLTQAQREVENASLNLRLAQEAVEALGEGE